jgi:phage-related baseplate assembly protein
MNLSDLTTPPTSDEVKTSIYDKLAGYGIDATAWKPGAWMRTIIAVVAVVFAGLWSLVASVAASGFLTLSTGDWLTLVARYVYGVERDTGSFASGNLTFDNASGFVYTGNAGDLTALNPTTLKTYKNTAPYTIGAMATGVVIPFQAVELGGASTSTTNTITALATPLTGVTVTNAAPLVGNDPEADDALRLRCEEKPASLSPNGPKDAYAYFARAAMLNGVNCGVTRVKTIADGIGGLDIYVADASGTLTGTVGDLTSKLGVVDDDIQTQVAPQAITARTHSASAHTIAVTYELWIARSSMLDADVEAAVALQLTKWLAASPIGGYDVGAGGKIYVSALEAVIGATEGINVIRVAVTLPAADVSISSTQAPVLGTVIVTALHQIDLGVI